MSGSPAHPALPRPANDLADRADVSGDRCDPDEISNLVRSGSELALDRIARCYFDDLLGVGRCACRDPSHAPDAVQEALLSALERQDQFRGDGSVKAWLSRMVVNACRCSERGRKNDPSWNHELDEQRAVRVAPSPADDAARAELARALRSAIDELAHEDQALFLASQLSGESAHELGRAYGLTAEAVRARLSRARKRLRRALGPEWQDACSRR